MFLNTMNVAPSTIPEEVYFIIWKQYKKKALSDMA